MVNFFNCNEDWEIAFEADGSAYPRQLKAAQLPMNRAFYQSPVNWKVSVQEFVIKQESGKELNGFFDPSAHFSAFVLCWDLHHNFHIIPMDRIYLSTHNNRKLYKEVEGLLPWKVTGSLVLQLFISRQDTTKLPIQLEQIQPDFELIEAGPQHFDQVAGSVSQSLAAIAGQVFCELYRKNVVSSLLLDQKEHLLKATNLYCELQIKISK